MFDFKNSNLNEVLTILSQSKNIQQFHMSDKGLSILLNGNDATKTPFRPLPHVESQTTKMEIAVDADEEREKAKRSIWAEQDALEQLAIDDPFEYEQLLANRGATDNGPR